MGAFHHELTLATGVNYSECVLRLCWGTSEEVELVIPSGVYADAHALTDAVATAMSAILPGGTAGLDSDHRMVLSAATPFTYGIPSTADGQARLCPLLEILGFTSTDPPPLALSQQAARTPLNVLVFERPVNRDVDALHVLAEAACGLDGRKKQVLCGVTRRRTLRVPFLSQREADHVRRWVERAAEGRALRLYDAMSNYESARLDPDQMAGKHSWLTRKSRYAPYWTATLTFVLED